MAIVTETNDCTYCHREKTGRFVKSGIHSGWSQHMPGMVWSCYDCTPDTLEAPVSPVPNPTVMITSLSPVVRAKAQREGLALLTPLQQEIEGLSIQTADDYLIADGYLGRVCEARKRWASKLAPILDPLAASMRLAKQAMEGAKGLLNEVDKPLEQLELRLRAGMKTFKVEEQRQLQEARQEQERLQREIELKAQQEAAARTAPQRARIAQQRETLEQLAVSVEEETPLAVTGEQSKTRGKRAWRIKDLPAFLRSVASGELESDCVLVNTVVMNRYFKEHGEDMAAWPGVELFDDVIIVKR